MRSFVASIFIIGLMVPALSSALTVDDIRQQIAVLLEQLATIQEQIRVQSELETHTQAGTESGTRAVCPIFNTVFGRGYSGGAVSELQKFLVDRGFLGSGLITGYFGHLTETALKSFQAEERIVSSGAPSTSGWGFAGPRTLALVTRLCIEKATVQPSTQTQPVCTVYQEPLCTNGTLELKGIDANGCSLGYRCVVSIVCPVLPVLDCVPGYSYVPGGIDANGCRQAGTCTLPVNTTSCPLYQQPPCPSGSHPVSGRYDYATGCHGAPSCVAN